MPFDRNLLPEAVSYYKSQGLTLKGARSAKWKTTSCNFHGGSDSMRVNTASGGWCCMACGAKGGDVLAYEIEVTGADFIDAAKALGAWVEDGKPHSPQKSSPLSPRTALTVLQFEATLVAVAGGNVAHGVALTTIDLKRLLKAANRIINLVDAFA